MGTSPLSPQDIRAAAGAHHDLGPEYSDAVVASFIEKVDQEIAARVEERLAASRPRARPVEAGEPPCGAEGLRARRGRQRRHCAPHRGGRAGTSRALAAACPSGGLRRWLTMGQPAVGEPQGCAVAGASRRRRRLPPADLTATGRQSTRWPGGGLSRPGRGFQAWHYTPCRHGSHDHERLPRSGVRGGLPRCVACAGAVGRYGAPGPPNPASGRSAGGSMRNLAGIVARRMAACSAARFAAVGGSHR